jgi:hypothetical protein
MYKFKIRITNKWLSINYEFNLNDNISFKRKIILVAIEISALIGMIKIVFSIFFLSG